MPSMIPAALAAAPAAAGTAAAAAPLAAGAFGVPTAALSAGMAGAGIPALAAGQMAGPFAGVGEGLTVTLPQVGGLSGILGKGLAQMGAGGPMMQGLRGAQMAQDLMGGGQPPPQMAPPAPAAPVGGGERLRPPNPAQIAAYRRQMRRGM